MSSGRVVRPSPMAEGRAQLKQKSNNRSQRLRDTPAFPIFHDSRQLHLPESWQLEEGLLARLGAMAGPDGVLKAAHQKRMSHPPKGPGRRSSRPAPARRAAPAGLPIRGAATH